MTCTNLSPSLLCWHSFRGYNSTVLKRVFRILIPLNVIYDIPGVYAYTAHLCGGISSPLWLSWTGLKKKKNGRQAKPINFNVLRGDWAETKRCVAAANHPWPKSRSGYWSQRGSRHHWTWAPRYGSCPQASPPTNSRSLCFSLRWNERSWSSHRLGLFHVPGPGMATFQIGEDAPSSSGPTPPVSCQDSVQFWL